MNRPRRTDPILPSVLKLVVLLVGSTVAATAGAQDRPWSDPSLPPAERARMAVEQMTDEEKLSLVHGVIAAPWGHKPKPAGSIGSAGYVPGVPRLGIPALQETDAELGVANPGDVRPGDTATAMPSDLALASTWDMSLARLQGQTVAGKRARKASMSFSAAPPISFATRAAAAISNISPRTRCSPELMAGSMIAGAQSRGLISTIKHFALNAQETDRVVLDARIDPAAMRESDLLAFEIAIERGRPAPSCAPITR